MKQYVIGENEQGIRLDKQLLKILNNAGQGFVYKMLRKKNITLNDKKATGSEHLNPGDIIKIFISDETFAKFSSRPDIDALPFFGDNAIADMSSLIIFEDEDLIIVNKPAGILSQKADKNDISINEMCIGHMKKKGELDDDKMIMFKPSVCNRLDRNTSGIIIFAKNYSTAAEMNRALNERSIHKFYLCIVKGRLKKEGQKESYLIKDHEHNRVTVTDEQSVGAQKIITKYRPIALREEMTLIETELITGRSHQIRAQMAALGHPLIGDDKYGDRELNRKINKDLNISSQLLHAYRLSFPQGLKGKPEKYAGKDFIAPVPDDFDRIVREYICPLGTAGVLEDLHLKT